MHFPPSAYLILFKIKDKAIRSQLKAIITKGLWMEFIEILATQEVWDLQNALIQFGLSHPKEFELKYTFTIKPRTAINN